MKTVIRLSQGEVAEIIAATLGYNGIEVNDIAFDISSGELEVVATSESEQGLKVKDKPEEFDSYSDQLISRWRNGR